MAQFLQIHKLHSKCVMILYTNSHLRFILFCFHILSLSDVLTSLSLYLYKSPYVCFSWSSYINFRGKMDHTSIYNIGF